MLITKRDGSKEKFNVHKILNAIKRAFKACDMETPQIVIDLIENNSYKDGMSVEEIQDFVENILMDTDHEVAKAFILYREKHKQIRDNVARNINFINNFIASDNTANATIDDNSNVANHNIAVMNTEIHKQENKETNIKMWYKKIKELYGEDTAKHFLVDINSIAYPHDISSQICMPYTYSSKEVIEVLYNGKSLLLPMDLLYDIVDEPEELVDSINVVYQKHPWYMYIKDINNTYTKVTTLTRKKRHRSLVRVKTAFGEDLVVTDNHPMIVDKDNIENTVPAIESLSCQQYRIGTSIKFKGKNTIDIVSILPTWVEYTDYFVKYQQSVLKRYIKVDRELGYIIGFFVGDGGYNNTSRYISFAQKDKSVLKDINGKIYKCLGIAGTIGRSSGVNKDKYVLDLRNQYIYELFRGFFKIQDKAQNKTLPYNILEFNEEFAKGCLEGLIDSDGTIRNDDCNINIRLSSRACILQCTYLFRYFGYSIGNGMQSLPFSNNTSYHTNYTIWGINATKRSDSADLNGSFKVRKKLVNTKCNSLKYKSKGYCNITHVEEIEEESAFYSLNEFIYDITTETHSFASNNILVHNCVAITMYPFLLHGIKDIGGLSAAPKNIDSFCGLFVNLVFAIASQYKGAVAVPGMLLCMDFFLRKEWGDNYYQQPDAVISSDYCLRKMTIHKQIHQYFQQICYSLMQPSGSRGNQSCFWNVSVFDKPFFDTMYGDFYFPDDTKPVWESLNWLQKDFLHWLNQERLKCILTFPVISVCLIYQNGEFLDKELAEYVAQEYAQGNSFFTYISDSADSLSSCCFSADTKVLWKSSTTGVHCTTLKELYDTPWEPYKKNLRIFHNGSWINGKAIKLPNRKMIKITTFNNKEFIMSDNHINLTWEGEKQTDALTTDDYLMFNTSVLNPIKEIDEHLTYEQGLLIGMFIGDGTFGNYVCEDGSVHAFQLSLNEQKWAIAKDSLLKLGNFTLGKIYNNVLPVHCYNNKELVAFIMRWTGNEPNHTNTLNKSLNLDCLLQSVEFRRGILDGWYITDGGNSNRCYTISKQLVENMEILCTSLGLQTIINVSDRTDEPIIIRGKEFNRNYPLYCLRWYTEDNHRCNKTVQQEWKKKNNSVYWKIKSIEAVEYSNDIYCITCNNQEEPYFTLPCGLITHNCRLSSKISKPQFNFTNGQLSEMTGSKNVITLDFNRIIQDFDHFLVADNLGFVSQGHSKMLFKEERDIWKEMFKKYLINILDRIYKYQTAYNEELKWMQSKHMLTVYDAGFIDMKKQYLTIGINGLNQAAEFLGMKCNKNDDYEDFCSFIFSTIKEQNTLHKTKELMFNTEFTPCESAAIKLYNRDKKDGYWVPSDTNLYASYIFKPNDDEISILDKIYLHGRNFCGDNLDGGSSAHLNLDHHLDAEQYRKLLEYAAEVGCKYFTFNVPNSECQDCGYITKVPITKCPKCGSTHIDYYDRVIGYLTRIKNWSKGRQIEQKTRVYQKIV